MKTNKYKLLLEENNNIFANKIKEFKQEMELISRLMFESLPLIKTQLRLDEYSSLDFNAIQGENGSKKKREVLQRILDSILARKKEYGFSDSLSSCNLRKELTKISSMDNLKRVNNLTRSEFISNDQSTLIIPCNCVKTDIDKLNKNIERLKAKESSLLKRIISLEQSDEDNKNKIESLHRTINSLKTYNKVILDKLSFESRFENIENEKQVDLPIPSFVKASNYELLLDDAIGIPSEMICESIRSTDENFIGIVDNKPCIVLNKTDPTLLLKKQITKNSIDSANNMNKIVCKYPNRSFFYENKSKDSCG